MQVSEGRRQLALMLDRTADQPGWLVCGELLVLSCTAGGGLDAEALVVFCVQVSGLSCGVQ